jgi:hypothetical protein
LNVGGLFRHVQNTALEVSGRDLDDAMESGELMQY